MITLNETNLRGSEKPDVPGYYAFNKNRKGKNGGGVCTAVSNRDSGNVIKLLEGKKNELLVTRHDQFVKPINLLNLYGRTRM